MVAMVMATLTMLVQVASRASVDRDEVTRRALVEAKRALIGRAAMASQGPGHFLCPDTPADDHLPGMIGASPGTTCSITVGRLPWKTLELPDLRDASGERLWYAVSERFINKATNTYPVNSDSKGQIQVNGLGAGEVIAVVFAPGPPLPGQSRDTEAQLAAVNNYLEGANADESTDAFEARIASADFNDRLIVIRAEDVFPIAEVVAAQALQQHMGKFLDEYRQQWADATATGGFYPRPRAFADPSQSGSYCAGSGAVQSGLFPAGRGAACVQFANTPTSAGDDIVITMQSCSITENADTKFLANLNCDIYFEVTGTAPRVSVTMNLSGLTQSLGLPAENTDITYQLSSSKHQTATSATLTHSLGSGNVVNLTYAANLSAAQTFSAVNVTIPIPWAPESTEISAAADVHWYFRNEWYRNSYYAVSNSIASGGTAPCAVGNCLILNKPSATENDKDIVLLLSGMTLKGKTRPSAALDAYFEGGNIDGDSVYQYPRRSDSGNDKAAGIRFGNP